MIEIILGVFKESFFLLNKMSIYLLFGFLFAGVVHIFLTESVIAKHLGKNSFLSVIKAALLGIPLPICSCGVVPAAMSLKREGASKGAVLSFLIATPTSGVDSIMATYSLLGGFFAVYRTVASFVAATFAGILVNILLKGEELSTVVTAKDDNACNVCSCLREHDEVEHSHSLVEKIKGVFTYAFIGLLKDIGNWLLIGILVGGIISYLLPSEFIYNYLGSGWKSMFLMLLIGIPMYVCATGSIPIVASLVLKGLNPGAAFVFLLACPATNSVSLMVIAKELGVKAAAIYLFAISFSAVVLGGILNALWGYLNVKSFVDIVHEHAMIATAWWEILASVVLVGLIIYTQISKKK